MLAIKSRLRLAGKAVITVLDQCAVEVDVSAVKEARDHTSVKEVEETRDLVLTVVRARLRELADRHVQGPEDGVMLVPARQLWDLVKPFKDAH